MRDLRPPRYVPPGSKGLLYRDAEVRAALDALLRRPLTIDQLRALLGDQLGPERTPSRSAIGRYTRRERLGFGYRAPRLWGVPRPDRPPARRS